MIHLYHNLLVPPENILNTAVGYFTKGKDEGNEDIIVNTGSFLTIFLQISDKVDSESDEDTIVIKRHHSEPMFAHIYSIAKLSIGDNPFDYLVVSSDSGNITVFECLLSKFKPIISLPFGRSGLKSLEPGYFLSVSPSGNAILLSAVDKNKIAWPVVENAENVFLLMDPVENNKKNTYTYSTVALYTLDDTSIFAALECNFSATNETFDASKHPKMLSIIVLDHGLNMLLRAGKKDEPVHIPPSSNQLIAIPIHQKLEFSGGVLVCSDGLLQYFLLNGIEISTTFETKLPQRRKHDTSIIVSGTSFIIDSDDNCFWFAILQNQFGDLIYCSTYRDGDGGYHLGAKYLSTVSICNNMQILSNGILVCFGESMIEYIVIKSFVCEFHESELYTPIVLSDDTNNEYISVYQNSEPLTSRLTKIITVPSHSDPTGAIISIHGSGLSSTLKKTTRGTSTRVVFNQILGGGMLFVKSLNTNPRKNKDTLLFISTEDHTRIYTIRGTKLEEQKESKHILDSKTLEVLYFEGYIIQITRVCIRVCSADETSNNKPKTWKRDENDCFIDRVSINSSQVIVKFNDNSLTSFYLNNDTIISEESSFKIDSYDKVVAMSILPLTNNCIRTDYLAVAISKDEGLNEISIYTLNTWEVKFTKLDTDINAPISDIQFMYSSGVGYILYVGYMNGFVSRYNFDETETTLALSDVFVVGLSPVTFSLTKVNEIIINSDITIITSSTSTKRLSFQSNNFNFQGKLNSASSLVGDMFYNKGFVGVSDNNLVFFEIENIDSSMCTETMKLYESPRHLHHLEDEKVLVISGDRDKDGIYTSYVHIIDINKMSFLYSLRYDGLITSFAEIESNDSHYEICIGSVDYLTHLPLSFIGQKVRVLKFDKNLPKSDYNNQFITHTKDVAGVPLAISKFNDYILVGNGNSLDLLKKGDNFLLNNSSNKSFPTNINFIQTFGLRIIVGDSSESYYFCKYDTTEKIISIFADDSTPRFPLASLCPDRSTVVSGDRFGHFCMLRIAKEISDESEIDPSGLGHALEHSEYSGSRNKAEVIVSYQIGAPITGLAFTQDRNSIVYGTVNGEIGMFNYIGSDVEVNILKSLENVMRTSKFSPLGRIHELFRSFYAPVKNCTDGTLIEKFLKLPVSEQTEIAKKIKMELSSLRTNLSELTHDDITRIIAKRTGF